MKKNIYSIICLLMLFALCGCISMTGNNAIKSVEFTKLPEKAILVNATAELNAEIIVVQGENASKYQLKVIQVISI